MIKEFGTIARAEIFAVDSPAITIETVSSDIRIMESHDGKTYIDVLGDSDEARTAASAAEITLNGRNISVRLDRNASGFKFFTFMRSAELTVLVRIPAHASIVAKTVSAEVEVHASSASAKISSVSGDVRVLHNPAIRCSVKTISGDITCTSLSRCDFSLRSVSGDIKVYVISGLDIEVDGKSVSGELQSEIPLQVNVDQPLSGLTDAESVKISASTVSGDVTIARNQATIE